MMDTKLLIALCALLVLNSVSADHEENQGAHSLSSTTSPGAAEASVAALSPHPTSHAESSSNTNQTSSGPSNISSTSTENQTIPTPLNPVIDNGNYASPTPPPVFSEKTQVKTSGLVTEVSPGMTVVSDKSENSTNQLPPQPPTVPSENPHSTSHTSLLPPTPSITHIAHTTPVPFTTPSLLNPNISVSLTPGSATPSKQATLPETTSTTSAPKPESQNPTISSTTTTTTTQSSSTSSTSSSKTSSSHLTTETSHLSTQDKTSSTSQPKPTVPPLSRTSTQAKTHSGSPSQLNVGGDTTVAHDSPTLDPLLAGLVSAFIITAVIITLLLFLKLRRRDNRPEFRRLQDLPMDDMMEDTPLSMYSY